MQQLILILYLVSLFPNCLNLLFPHQVVALSHSVLFGVIEGLDGISGFPADIFSAFLPAAAVSIPASSLVLLLLR